MKTVRVGVGGKGGGCGGWVGGGHCPHPPGLPIRRECVEVHTNLSDLVGPIAATHVPQLWVVAHALQKKMVDLPGGQEYDAVM